MPQGLRATKANMDRSSVASGWSLNCFHGCRPLGGDRLYERYEVLASFSEKGERDDSADARR